MKLTLCMKQYTFHFCQSMGSVTYTKIPLPILFRKRCSNLIFATIKDSSNSLSLHKLLAISYFYYNNFFVS